MDDIIVLILTLIFIVAGIFGQMKKRQAVPAPESENRGAEDNFWELLDEELDKVRPPETIIPPKNEEVKNQEINLEKPKYVFSSEREGQRIFDNPLNERKIETESKKSTIKKKRFPLREAVIYSEILNRKYI